MLSIGNTPGVTQLSPGGSLPAMQSVGDAHHGLDSLHCFVAVWGIWWHESGKNPMYNTKLTHAFAGANI